MKSLLLLFLFLFPSISTFANTDKEIVIIRVEYVIKKAGWESRIFCDIGVSNTHSLYRSLTNQENTVQIKDENDKLHVFTSEIDLMNYLFNLGYQYESTYLNEIVGSKYTNFVLVKE